MAKCAFPWYVSRQIAPGLSLPPSIQHIWLNSSHGSVSYTHLDVYKRQSKRCSIFRIEPVILFIILLYLLIAFILLSSFLSINYYHYCLYFLSKIILLSHKAVSYTHLDVYKRQYKNRSKTHQQITQPIIITRQSSLG